MNTGATFKLSGNTCLDGAKESVVWKSNESWTPTYVKQ